MGKQIFSDNSEQQAFVCCQWKEVGETCSSCNAAQALLLEKRFSAHISLAGEISLRKGCLK